MFTVCPKCALTLAVTAADLRVAQGYVRCGRCSSVFNALARLTEERQPGAASEPLTLLPDAAAQDPSASDAAVPAKPSPTTSTGEAAIEAPPTPAMTVAQSREPETEESLEFNPATTDVNSVFVQPPPDPQWTAATGSFRALVAANQETPAAELLPDSQVDVEIDAAFLASMLRTESRAPAVPAATPASPVPPVPAETARAPASTTPFVAPPLTKGPRHGEPHARPATAAVRAPGARSPQAPPARPPDPLPARLEATAPAAAPEPDTPEEAAAHEDEPPAGVFDQARASLRAHIWGLAVAAGALLLVAQVINHSRDDLAASARFNRPLTAFYGALGIKLYPRWDLRAYDVRQLGASAAEAGAGVITVRATIKNESPQAQPLPLLRVTLQDRFGNRIAARDVQPRAYLPGALPPSSFLSAGQRIDAEIGLADPGTDAVGFEIDACLPARGGTACANDTALR
jgi:predicted Zn finger-like uncharacterized protein